MDLDGLSSSRRINDQMWDNETGCALNIYVVQSKKSMKFVLHCIQNILLIIWMAFDLANYMVE